MSFMCVFGISRMQRNDFLSLLKSSGAIFWLIELLDLSMKHFSTEENVPEINNEIKGYVACKIDNEDDRMNDMNLQCCTFFFLAN